MTDRPGSPGRAPQAAGPKSGATRPRSPAPGTRVPREATGSLARGPARRDARRSRARRSNSHSSNSRTSGSGCDLTRRIGRNRIDRLLGLGLALVAAQALEVRALVLRDPPRWPRPRAPALRYPARPSSPGSRCRGGGTVIDRKALWTSTAPISASLRLASRTGNIRTHREPDPGLERPRRPRSGRCGGR